METLVGNKYEIYCWMEDKGNMEELILHTYLHCESRNKTVPLPLVEHSTLHIPFWNIKYTTSLENRLAV